jgi:putative ABC transport system substrate-binding protein
MRRREFFVTLLGSAVVASPLGARAQQTAMPAVGFLDVGPLNTQVLAAFVKGLGEMGFVEGQNVAIESRFAQGDASRLPDLAADLVRRRVAVIATLGGVTSVRAVRAASAMLPIVFEAGADPVQTGLGPRAASQG